MKRILLLGASGTVGSAIFDHLSRDKGLKVTGTCFSSAHKNSPDMLRFCVECPDDIRPILERVRPDVVISSLRGDYNGQLSTHENIAKYLMTNNGKMIYLSTANVFDGKLDRPHYETDTRISDSDYGQFKIQCEDLLLSQMDNRVVILRLPFVWGRNSPRMQAVKDGCKSGQVNVYTNFFSNHASDLQIARIIRWIISENKEGIFHIGTSDVVSYPSFIKQLIAAAGMNPPQYIFQENPGTMAVLSSRDDIPDTFRFGSQDLIQYLCGRKDY